MKYESNKVLYTAGWNKSVKGYRDGVFECHTCVSEIVQANAFGKCVVSNLSIRLLDFNKQIV